MDYWRTTGDAAVGNNTVKGSTVTETTVQNQNDATVFLNLVQNSILKELSIVSQLDSPNILENEGEVLCSVRMQQKMDRYKEEAVALLKGETHLRTRNNKVKASVETKWVSIILTAILDTDAGPNLLKKKFLPLSWARHTVTVKATRLRAAANTRLNAN